jgi:septal ring-binding cell division protein DamX
MPVAATGTAPAKAAAPAPSGPAPASSSTSSPAPSPAPASTGSAAATTRLAAADPDQIALRSAAGRDLVADTGDGFAVQLMVTDASDRAYLASYLDEAGKALGGERLYVVPMPGAEGRRVGLLYGTFPDRGAAGEALAAIPANLRQFRPFVRSLSGVRDDARRATHP